jgi:hypothetical protein
VTKQCGNNSVPGFVVHNIFHELEPGFAHLIGYPNQAATQSLSAQREEVVLVPGARERRLPATQDNLPCSLRRHAMQFEMHVVFVIGWHLWKRSPRTGRDQQGLVKRPRQPTACR